MPRARAAGRRPTRSRGRSSRRMVSIRPGNHQLSESRNVTISPRASRIPWLRADAAPRPAPRTTRTRGSERRSSIATAAGWSWAPSSTIKSSQPAWLWASTEATARRSSIGRARTGRMIETRSASGIGGSTACAAWAATRAEVVVPSCRQASADMARWSPTAFWSECTAWLMASRWSVSAAVEALASRRSSSTRTSSAATRAFVSAKSAGTRRRRAIAWRARSGKSERRRGPADWSSSSGIDEPYRPACTALPWPPRQTVRRADAPGLQELREPHLPERGDGAEVQPRPRARGALALPDRLPQVRAPAGRRELEPRHASSRHRRPTSPSTPSTATTAPWPPCSTRPRTTSTRSAPRSSPRSRRSRAARDASSASSAASARRPDLGKPPEPPVAWGLRGPVRPLVRE